MAGINLAQANAKLAEWLAADTAVVRNQSYSINDRQMTRADAAINLGRTRADSELTLKIRADCADTLTALVKGLRL